MGSKKKYRKSFAEAVKSFDTKPQEEENVASDEMSADTLKKQVDKDIEEEIRPYAGLKTLIVERDTKCPMPELRAGMASLL